MIWNFDIENVRLKCSSKISKISGNFRTWFSKIRKFRSFRKFRKFPKFQKNVFEKTLGAAIEHRDDTQPQLNDRLASTRLAVSWVEIQCRPGRCLISEAPHCLRVTSSEISSLKKIGFFVIFSKFSKFPKFPRKKSKTSKTSEISNDFFSRTFENFDFRIFRKCIFEKNKKLKILKKWPKKLKIFFWTRKSQW